MSTVIAQEILEVWLGPLQGQRDAEDEAGLKLMTEVEAEAYGGA